MNERMYGGSGIVVIVIIIIIISGSTVLVRTLAVIYFRHLVGRVLMSDQLSQRPLPTQDNTNTERNIHGPSGIRTHDPCNQAAKTYVFDRAATGTGSERVSCYNHTSHIAENTSILQHKTSFKTQAKKVHLSVCIVSHRNPSGCGI
jgi:hypothetical protein